MSERKRDAQITGEKLKSKVRELLTNNLPLKVLALLLSVVLWAGLISQDETLTREKSFSDVNVSITGTDTMKRNGYIVTSDLSAALSDIDAVARFPRSSTIRRKPLPITFGWTWAGSPARGRRSFGC